MHPKEAPEQGLAESLNEAAALLARHRKEGTHALLRNAVDKLLTVDKSVPMTWFARAALDYNLGLGLTRLGAQSNDLELMERAIARLQSAAQVTDLGVQIPAMSELSAAHARHYETSGTLDHLHQAESAARQFVMLAERYDHDRVQAYAQLGVVLLRRHRETSESLALFEGVDALLRARSLDLQRFRDLSRASQSLLWGLGKRVELEPRAVDRTDWFDLVEEETQRSHPDSDLCDEGHRILALFHILRFDLRKKSEDRSSALELVRLRLVRSLGATSPRAAVLSGFAESVGRLATDLREALFEILARTDAPDAIEAALDANPRLRSAIYPTDDATDGLVDRWVTAVKVMDRYAETVDRDTLREAIALFDALLRDPGLHKTTLTFRVNVSIGAAKAFLEAYWDDGDMTHLGGAAALARSASKDAHAGLDSAEENPWFSMELVPRADHLFAVALTELFIRTRQRSYIDEAIERSSAAVKLSHLSGIAEALIHGSLGTAYRYRFKRSQDRGDIVAAIQSHQKAVALERDRVESGGHWELHEGRPVEVPLSRDRLAHLLNDLGTACRELHLATGDRSHLYRAREHHSEALALASTTWPSYRQLLASLLDDLWLAASGGHADAASEVSSWEAKTADFELDHPAHTLLLSLHVARQAFGNSDFQRAASAFAKASTAHDELARAYGGKTAEAPFRRAVTGLAAEHAYSLAKVSTPAEVAEVLEREASRFAAQGSRWDEAQLILLERTAPELVQALGDARAELALTECHVDAAMSETEASVVVREARRRRARQRLRATESAAAVHLESAGWNLHATVDRIQLELISDRSAHAVVYLATTARGSVGVIVGARDISVVWPTLSLPELERNWNAPHDAEQLERTLRDVLPLIGEHLMRPIAEEAARCGIRSLSLVPAGILRSLPLHVAEWSERGKRVMLVDAFHVSTLVSGAVALAARSRGRAVTDGCVLFGNPQPSPLSSLPLAAPEVRAVRALLGASERDAFVGERATMEHFRRSHRQASVFHFAGHAVFDARDPLESHLAFAGGERLTIREFLSEDVVPPPGSLAVLSACRSAALDVELSPHESLGIAAALALFGYTNVLGSRWPANDMAAALFALRFHELRKGGLDNADAFSRATVWLRDARGADLNRFARDHGLTSIHLPDSLEMRRCPDFWAPFVLMGF